MSTQASSGAGMVSLALRTLSGKLLELGQLQPGDVLSARVLAADGERVKLLLRGVRLQARTEVPLRPGESLRLEVAQTTPQQVILRPLTAAEPGGVSASTAQAAVDRSPDGSNTNLLAQMVVPLLAGGQVSEAAVLAERVEERSSRRRRAGQGQAGVQLAIHWEGPDLGPVRARLYLAFAEPGSTGLLSVGLAVATAEVRDLALGRLQELKESLERLGWAGVQVGCQLVAAPLLRAECAQAAPFRVRALDLKG